METKSNHSANAANNNTSASTGQLNPNVSQSLTDKIASTPTMENVQNAGMPVQSIDILKETKEKADITKPSDDMMAKVPSSKLSEMPVLSSIISQRQSMLTSEEQMEIPPPNPTIVAQSVESGLFGAGNDATGKLPNVQTVFPQQTIQSSAAQFKAEMTVKDNVSNVADNKIDDAPQELSCRRNTSTNNNNNNNATGFDGFAGKMNKLRDQMSNIFPAGIMGCREKSADNGHIVEPANTTDVNSNGRRFMDAKEASQDCVGHIDSTPRKRPNSCKPNMGRNPLTGIGLDNEDDSKKGFGRRKDGNPVLGVGYGTDSTEDTSKPTGRVPPGGHSTKLW